MLDRGLSLCQLFDPEILADPYPLYRRLREQEPVRWDPYMHAWVVTRYAGVAAVLHSCHAEQTPSLGRLRAVASACFSAQRLDFLSPIIQDVAEDLTAGFADREALDLISEFAQVLAARVAAELTRRCPPPQVEINGEPMDAREVIASCEAILAGGRQLVANVIANSLLTLLRHPRQMQRLLQHPELIEPALEELLRYESPIQHATRLAPRDLTIGGVEIKHGEPVIGVVAAANRDPERFPDPDRLDLTRPDNRHLALASAPPFPVAASLVKWEGRIALTALLRRLPRMKLEPGTKLHWSESLGLRSLQELPIRCRSGAGQATQLVMAET